MNEQTGFTATTTLRTRAEALALAQLAGIHDGYTWVQAYDELLGAEPGTGSCHDLKSFTPVEHLDHLSIDAFYARVETAADAIHKVLVDAQSPAEKSFSDNREGFQEWINTCPVSLKFLSDDYGECSVCFFYPEDEVAE